MRYVKLSEDRTEIKSSIHEKLPRSIRGMSNEQLQKYNWFPVIDVYEGEESRYTSPVRKGWDMSDGMVRLLWVHEKHPRYVIIRMLENDINTIRDRKLITVLSIDGVPYDFSQKTRQILDSKVIQATISTTKTFEWITAENTTIELSAEEIKSISKVFSEYETEVYLTARSMKDNLENMEVPENIDYEKDWPETEYTTKENI